MSALKLSLPIFGVLSVLVIAGCKKDDPAFDGGEEDAGPPPTDYEWSRWPPPADAPTPSAYSLSDTTATDTTTGLLWQRTVYDVAMDWESAKLFCRGFGANSRLPTRVELESIVSFDDGSPPAIDSFVFPGTPSAWFWSSSPFAGSSKSTWVVGFGYGNTGSSYGAASTNHVRCVSSAPTDTSAAPPDRYQVSTDSVLDTRTNLTWQRAVPAMTYRWAEAKAYCQTSSLAGAGGWRLPTVKELQSLVDVRELNPAIDATAFPGTPVGAFWSSSPAPAARGLAWAVRFYYGYTEVGGLNAASYVRCVK